MPHDEDEDSWKVNVPLSDVPAMSGASESGFALVKYRKDGEAFCLDLISLRPSSEAPMDDMDEDDDSDYDSLSQALSKTMKKTAPNSTDDGDGDEG